MKPTMENAAEMMNSSSYVDRFQSECIALHIRIERLEAMLEKYKAGTLDFSPKCSYDLLHEQLMVMKSYMDILEKRALIEGVDISFIK